MQESIVLKIKEDNNNRNNFANAIINVFDKLGLDTKNHPLDKTIEKVEKFIYSNEDKYKDNSNVLISIAENIKDKFKGVTDEF